MEVEALKKELTEAREANHVLSSRCQEQEQKLKQYSAEINGARDAVAASPHSHSPAAAAVYDAELRRVQAAARRKEQLMTAKINELRGKLAQVYTPTTDAAAQTDADDRVDEATVDELSQRLDAYHAHLTTTSEVLRKSRDNQKRSAFALAALSAASRAKELRHSAETDELKRQLSEGASAEVAALMNEEIMALKELNEHLQIARDAAEKSLETKEAERNSLEEELGKAKAKIFTYDDAFEDAKALYAEREAAIDGLVRSGRKGCRDRDCARSFERAFCIRKRDERTAKERRGCPNRR